MCNPMIQVPSMYNITELYRVAPKHHMSFDLAIHLVYMENEYGKLLYSSGNIYEKSVLNMASI